jgi:alkanesulfonate monooxygenase SsuD/methylene tetrahydromethanopterin reductase-like flavin-dependent oxidoreductase (luciferase family)
MLGITLYGGQGLSYRDAVDLARLAEDRGFDAVFVAETFVNDGMATCLAMAMGTRRITVGAGIANVYLRHPATLGAAAVAIDELSDGRFILGLGVNHERFVTGLGLTWEEPRRKLRDTTAALRTVLSGGTLPGMHLPCRAATHRIPIHLAGVALATARLAGEIADGLMGYLAIPERFAEVARAAREAASSAGRPADAVTPSLLIPTFVSDDLGAARQTARQFLAGYLALPVYARMFRDCGFAGEVEAVRAAFARGDRASTAAALSERFVNEVCVLGPAARCRERLAEFRAAGIDFPILAAQPVGESYADGARRIIETLHPRIS